MYFEEGKPLNSKVDLVSCAKEVGVSGAEEYLESDVDIQEVRTEAAKWTQRIQGSGVPYFIIKNMRNPEKTVEFAGGQPAESFAKVFLKLS